MNYRYVLKLLLPDLKRNYDKNPNTCKQETSVVISESRFYMLTGRLNTDTSPQNFWTTFLENDWTRRAAQLRLKWNQFSNFVFVLEDVRLLKNYGQVMFKFQFLCKHVS